MPTVERKAPANRCTNIPFTRPTFVDVAVEDEQGNPITGAKYRLELADGEIVEGELDDQGRVRREDVLRGICRFELVWEDDTREVRMKLEDEEGNVFADTPYELRVLGKTYAGQTDGEGRLLQKVPAEATDGELVFWAALDGPDAPREEMSFELRL